jgi:hypothetical protein
VCRPYDATLITTVTCILCGAPGHGACVPFWPTPDAGAFNVGQSIEAYTTRKARERLKGYNGNGGGTVLGMAAQLGPGWALAAGQRCNCRCHHEPSTTPPAAMTSTPTSSPPPITLGCLFDGIHGFGLGLNAAHPAFVAAWTAENADFPHRILEQRVPYATHLTDIREIHGPPKVTGISAGFPCQDISPAGLGAGITGSRSGLWTECARIIGEVQPEFVLLENVAMLLRRGMEVVVENLVELGYSVEWDCLPAAAFGAPHLRDRVWIVAHREPEPFVFGQPMALFAMEPAGAAELVGTGESDDGDEAPIAGWWRWPRAGFVTGDPRLVMPLEPLAPLSAAKAGRVLLPTPQAADGDRVSEQGVRYYRNGTDNPTLLGAACRLDGVANDKLLPTPQASDGSGGRIDADISPHRPSGAKRSITLATAVHHGLWPTPHGMSGNGGTTPYDGHGNELSQAVRVADGLSESKRSAARVPQWPTAKASPSGPDYARAGRDGSGGDDLATRVAKVERDRPACGCLWDFVDGDGFCACCHAHLDDPAGLYAIQPAEPHPLSRCPLHRQPVERLPTPRATDGDPRNRGDLIVRVKDRPNSHHPGDRPDGREQERRPGALNPTWVEALMGFPIGWTDPREPRHAHDLILAHGYACEIVAVQAMRGMRSNTHSSPLRKALGGCGRLPETEILLAELRELAEDGRPSSALLEGEEAREASVRGLRADDQPRRASHRPGIHERRSDEPADSLQAMSRLLARACQETWPASRWFDAFPHLDGVIPRLNADSTHRKDRLTALGNALVPQAPAWIGARVLARLAR